VKVVDLIFRLVMGGIFIASAVAKIWNVQVSHAHGIVFSHVPDLAAFAGDVANYHVPPRALANLVAITLPWIELVAGGLLVCGIWKRASAWVITAMMVVFLAAIGWALAHGYDIRCGCFGTVDARKVGVVALLEDGGMLAMAVWLAWRLKDGSAANDGGKL
jgi:putative oxidoreductase